MAAGAAVQPHRCQFILLIGGPPALGSDSGRNWRFLAFRQRTCPFSNRRPVGQTCTHLPHSVQVSDSPQGCVQIGDDAAVDAAAHHVPGVRAFDLIAHAHAAGAQDAAVVVEDESVVRGVHRQAADTDRGSGRASCPSFCGKRSATRNGRWPRRPSTRDCARRTAVRG